MTVYDDWMARAASVDALGHPERAQLIRDMVNLADDARLPDLYVLPVLRVAGLLVDDVLASRQAPGQPDAAAATAPQDLKA